jgi:thymidylate synthase (FAD)
MDFMGGDLSIVNAAKVSTLGATAPTDEKLGLLSFLMKHRHGTPFEHNSMTFRITAPIFVWREFHRHRIGFSYNEESGRYKQLEPVFYMPNEERRKLSNKPEGWKPSKPSFVNLKETNETYWAFWTDHVKDAYEKAYASYEQALSFGIENGLARITLPVSIYSTCYVTCNARSLMSFLSLRVDADGMVGNEGKPDQTNWAVFPSYPLYEMHDLAIQLEQNFALLFPTTHSLFVKNGRVSP